MNNQSKMLYQRLWADVVEKKQEIQSPAHQPSKYKAIGTHDLGIKKMLMLAFLNWFKPVTEIYALAHLTKAVGNRMKEGLIRKGFVYEVKLQLESGRGKVINSLFLTDKGHDAIHVQRDVLKGKGFEIHKRFQYKLHNDLKSMGLKSIIELKMKEKSADLGIWLGENLRAVEIVVTTARLEHQNLIKDIEAGFDRVAFIVKDCEARHRVEKTIAEHCQEQIKNKYSVCYYYEFLELIKEQM